MRYEIRVPPRSENSETYLFGEHDNLAEAVRQTMAYLAARRRKGKGTALHILDTETGRAAHYTWDRHGPVMGAPYGQWLGEGGRVFGPVLGTEEKNEDVATDD